MKVRGPTPCSRGWGEPPWARPPTLWAAWWLSDAHLLPYEVLRWEKIEENLSGRDSAATRRNLGGTNLGLRQSCSAGDTSLREGEIIAIVITNAPLVGRGQSPSTSSPAPSPLKTLVHLLYPILVSKSGIGTCRLLVVLITPCSWCWFIWWKIICSDPICILLPLWLWTWICFVSNYVHSWGQGRSLAISSHVNLVFVWYFDKMYVV